MLGKDVVDGMHQPPDAARTASGGDEGAGAVRERQEPDLVASDQRDMRQQQHGVERMIQRREPAAGVARHHPAAIDQKHDPLALVVLEGANGQLAPAGRRAPVEMAWIIPFGVIAQSLELVVGPQPARARTPSTLSRSRRASIVYRAIWRTSG